MNAQSKIFLVDDDVFSLSLYQQGLHNLGYSNVSMFINGSHCLENMHQKPEVIFLDQNMDDITGAEVMKKIKQLNPGIFVVIVSSQDNIRTVIELLKCGAFDYLIKGDNEIEKMGEVLSRIDSLQIRTKKGKPSLVHKMYCMVCRGKHNEQEMLCSCWRAKYNG